MTNPATSERYCRTASSEASLKLSRISGPGWVPARVVEGAVEVEGSVVGAAGWVLLLGAVVGESAPYASKISGERVSAATVKRRIRPRLGRIAKSGTVSISALSSAALQRQLLPVCPVLVTTPA